MLSLPQWRPLHLFLAWVTYWILLVIAWLGSAIPLLFRISHTGSHGNASIAANDGVLRLLITTGAETLARSVSYGMLTMFVVVPPLLLFLLWVAVRPRRVV